MKKKDLPAKETKIAKKENVFKLLLFLLDSSFVSFRVFRRQISFFLKNLSSFFRFSDAGNCPIRLRLRAVRDRRNLFR